MADTPSRAEDSFPRVLCLDGGGVRGLSSLLILRDIMEDIESRTSADATPKPCEYFDLIGGTSTGGLIAIMLGLLGMVTSVNLLRLTERALTNASMPISRCRRKYSEWTMSLLGKSPLATIDVASTSIYSRQRQKNSFNNGLATKIILFLRNLNLRTFLRNVVPLSLQKWQAMLLRCQPFSDPILLKEHPEANAPSGRPHAQQQLLLPSLNL